MFFGGDPELPVAHELVKSLSTTFCTTFESMGWRDLFFQLHGERLKKSQRFEFLWDSLDIDHIHILKERVPKGIDIRRVDLDLAYRTNDDLETIMHCFNSHEDFVRQGIGFCALSGEKIVSGASSWIICNEGIEIQINTHPDFQRRGIATVVAAALIEYCLEKGIKPHWDAANSISAKFAEKLGYTLDEVYDVYWLVPNNA